ncbi:unnamed protein product [Schistosoma mattheei]|uniref:CIA30 domain-containing protein n=1 Tax=Schistosoma mattheei TaxID=31246 RepID=A0AA85BNX2_9TREM|nr:unnamed protein product [Schistosoma mattheei]
MIMKYISVVVLIFTTLLLNTYNAKEDDSLEPTSILFNFTDSQTTAFENWIEVSDAILLGGRSKAAIVRLNGTNYQSALLFYLLNPRENGSSFAGVYRQLDTPDISKYTGVVIDLHRQGVNSKFQFILYGECSEVRDCVSHESEFETPEIRGDVKIPFSRFKPHFRGTPKSDSNHLNLSHTSRIGIKVYGGSNAPENLFGPGSIEIFTISAYK